MFVESWCGMMKSTLEKESVPVLPLITLKTWGWPLNLSAFVFLPINQFTKSGLNQTQ